MKIRWIAALILVSFGCTKTTEIVRVESPEAQKVQDVPLGQSVDVREATSAQCAVGGIVYTVYIDVNLNSEFDGEDAIVKKYSVCNGSNAVPTEYTPVESIVACGNNVAYKEVLLRLQNGQVLGAFSSDTGGTMTRLAFLSDGTFMNTDNSGCVFVLTTSSDGKTRSISWDGRVQRSWQMN